MKRLSILLLSACAALCAVAQTDLKPAPAGLTADEVLKRHIEHTGGPAYQAHESMIMKATMTLKEQNLQAEITIYAKQPDKIMVHQNLAGMMEMTQGYDGSIGWESNPITGLRELEGKELANLQLTATFNYLTQWAELFPKRQLLGIQELAGGPAYVVQLVPEAASTMTVFIDVESYEMLRTDSNQVNAMGEIDMESYFSDFKEIEGVSMPMTITQQTPMGPAVMTVKEIKINVPIEDSVFTKPSAPPAPPTDQRQ